MRFFPDGPPIPDELLVARDEGRVVFFCGAGVSRAKAELPDFFSLAATVIDSLGVPFDSPIRSTLAEIRQIESRTGIPGLISVDRIFGLLEREFKTSDIQQAVALALRPKHVPPDVSAHNTLIDLATTREGIVRIVTTNFDRLFDDCDRETTSHLPPQLPDPSRPRELDGVIYLHGRASSDYQAAEGDGFVLSSSEFGHAYLSEGWATSFVREILARYVVVFIGYAADDPPIQYLLEALRKSPRKQGDIYAFHSGDVDHASARWFHKGVEAIPYNAHVDLWRTLEAWAERARDPDGWYANVITRSYVGPSKLLPHERGQVAHVISTLEGARRFSKMNPPPPAEWLCVFDPVRRYDRPSKFGGLLEDGPYVDPFELYGIDSDRGPIKVDPGQPDTDRNIPDGAWDAFMLNRRDRIALGDMNLAAFRGSGASTIPGMAARLEELAIWLANVAHQPASVWWAAHQQSIHPKIRTLINRKLNNADRASDTETRKAWRYLIEYWDKPRTDETFGRYELAEELNKDGWSNLTIRKYSEICRPYLSIRSSFWGGAIPPDEGREIQLRDLLMLEVKYPEHPDNITIPDEWLPLVVTELRRNIKFALDLESEIGGYGLRDVGSIFRGLAGDDDNRFAENLTSAMVSFAAQFKRLTNLDLKSSREEFMRWPDDSDDVFSRLRVWASHIPDLIDSASYAQLLTSLDDETFWDSLLSTDLIESLSSRWGGLDSATRMLIEQRIFEGPRQREEEEQTEFEKRRASAILNRTYRLTRNGCTFERDLELATEELRSLLPDWDPEHAVAIEEFFESGTGWVGETRNYVELLNGPVSTILQRASAIEESQEKLFTRHNPFAGLAEKRPVRAFSALRQASKKNEFPVEAWQSFLNSDARKNDSPRFVAWIAERLETYPVDSFIRAVTEWLRNVTEILSERHPDIFDRIVSHLIRSLENNPSEGGSTIVSEKRARDWTTEALNSPTGKLAQSLFSDLRAKSANREDGIDLDWLNHVDAMLALPDDLRRHALVVFSHKLHWFYWVDSSWTVASLLSVLDADNSHDKGAFWGGFFWGARTPGHDLYLHLKAHLLQLATEMEFSRKNYGQALAGMLLAGWASVQPGSTESFVSDSELRSVLLESDDDFRCNIIWQAKRWATSTSDSEVDWDKRLQELLRNVWPRQLSAKSPTVSARLCELAFSYEDRFPEMAALIHPLLSKIDQNSLIYPTLRKSDSVITDRYPSQVLDLLFTVLSDDPVNWPYGTNEVLERIAESDDSIKADEKFMELKRRWASR